MIVADDVETDDSYALKLRMLPPPVLKLYRPRAVLLMPGNVLLQDTEKLYPPETYPLDVPDVLQRATLSTLLTIYPGTGLELPGEGLRKKEARRREGECW